jgi:hypothetical protein
MDVSVFPITFVSMVVSEAIAIISPPRSKSALVPTHRVYPLEYASCPARPSVNDVGGSLSNGYFDEVLDVSEELGVVLGRPPLERKSLEFVDGIVRHALNLLTTYAAPSPIPIAAPMTMPTAMVSIVESS